jgi:hypothetical protein
VGVILLVGCGGGGGGTPTTDLICRGSGVIVGGKVTFIKRLYNERGLTGAQVTKPVRYALVEMVLEVDGRVVGTAYTDENGNYCVQARGVPPDFPTAYPRVASQTNQTLNIAVRSYNNGGLYSRPGEALNASRVGVYSRNIPIPLFVRLDDNVDFQLSGAFNIMDVLTTGMEQAMILTSQHRPREPLFAFWDPGTQLGVGSPGTYFVGGEAIDRPDQPASAIVLSGGDGSDTGDHDEFDDDVMLHEFGHFVAHSFSKPPEAGGTHYLNDNTQDIRLAWSEGWATFFSAAARESPVMVNSYGGDPGSLNHELSYAFDIETPHSDVLSTPQVGTPLEAHGVYTTSEVSVSSVLWDLYDSRNESGDRYSLGLQGVWDVFARMITAPPNVSLETFATLFANQFGGMTSLAETAKLRRVQFFPDEYEPGDSQVSGAPTIGPGVPGVVNEFTTCHTLYPAGDVDLVRVQLDTPRSVQIETFNLSNGADTVVQLLDASSVVQVENDNATLPRPFTPTVCGNRREPIPQDYFEAGINNGARLASSVGPVALPAGTYYARVTSRAAANSGRNVAAGELGSYDLVVTLD